MENSQKMSLTKKQQLLQTFHKLQKIDNESMRFYSSRNSPRNKIIPASNIMFPVIYDSDPASPTNIYIHHQILEKNNNGQQQTVPNNTNNNNIQSNRQSAPKQQKKQQKSQTSRQFNKRIGRTSHRTSNKYIINHNLFSQVSQNHTRSQMITPKKIMNSVDQIPLLQINQLNQSQIKNTNVMSSHRYNNRNNISIQQQQQYEISRKKYKLLNSKIDELNKQNNDLRKNMQQLTRKLNKAEKTIVQYRTSLKPYSNNVNLMQQKLSVIQKVYQKNQQEFSQQQNLKKLNQGQLDLKNKYSLNYQLQLLKITQQRQNQQYQEKINRLNLAISQIHKNCKQAESKNQELQRKVLCLDSIIHNGSYLKQMRELKAMTYEQLCTYKNENYYLKINKQKLESTVTKLRNKIYLLTSLIGYGVVTSVENNDLHDLEVFTDNINLGKGIQEAPNFDTFGLQSIKRNKVAMQLMENQMKMPVTPSLGLYLPNFLVFYDDIHLKNVLQDSTTIIIKPEFFLMMRAIFDSQYKQFIIHRRQVSKFPDYVFGFIDFFRLKRNQKRIEINSKVNGRRNSFNQYTGEIAKSSFFIKVFDKKIGSLLQVMTFKQFLFRNIPEDQIFYFLMCRNILLKGPQLSNYINCSDSYTFISYDYAHDVVLQLLQNYDRQLKATVINHITAKKVLKNKKILIKSSYILRLLLEIYRKIRQKKTIELKYIFQETTKITKKTFIEFKHFFQILNKNFPFLTRSQICLYYRKSVGIFESQNKNFLFFECFNCSCLPDILLQQGLAKDQKLKNTFLYKQSKKCLNYLFELVSDSVNQLGSQELYKQFVALAKLKQICHQDHIRITILFSKMMLAKLSNLSVNNKTKTKQNNQKLSNENKDQNLGQLQKSITKVFQQFNNAMIDVFNSNLKRRQKYQQKLDAASSKIGRHYRLKLQQFYSEFMEDINKQINPQDSSHL